MSTFSFYAEERYIDPIDNMAAEWGDPLEVMLAEEDIDDWSLDDLDDVVQEIVEDWSL